jgi:hypothetical protein
MKLLNRIVDWLQATFPPNRVVVLLGGVITAVSGTIAAWIATHVPGIQLSTGEVAGVIGATLLISIRLLDRWIDGWQAHEQIHYGEDLEGGFEDLVHAPAVSEVLDAHGVGALEALGHAVSELRGHVEAGGVQPAEIAQHLDAIAAGAAQALREQPAEPAQGEGE